MTSVAEVVSEDPKENKRNTAGETREQINLSSYPKWWQQVAKQKGIPPQFEMKMKCRQLSKISINKAKILDHTYPQNT